MQIYDSKLDKMREPTQADLDNFMALKRAWGQLLTHIRSHGDEQTRGFAEILQLRTQREWED